MAGYLGNSFLGNVQDTILGNGTDESGFLGIGQQKIDPNGYKYDQSAFQKSSKGLKEGFQKDLKAVNARKAPTAKAASIDQRPQAQFRNAQANLVGQLEAQAAGQGPSLAQSQLQSATDRNIQQQAALAASARGRTAGQGMRAAQMGAATANQQAARQSAETRMQEQMAARQQLAGVSSDARGQDIGLATNQAGLSQQANLANQQAALQAQAQKDAMSQFYNQGLVGLNQFNQNKAMALEQLKGQQYIAAQDAKYNAYESASNRKAGFTSGLLNPASDENVKTNIEPVKAEESQGTSLRETLDALSDTKNTSSSANMSKGTPDVAPASGAPEKPTKAVESQVTPVQQQGPSQVGNISTGAAQKALGTSVGDAIKKYAPMAMAAVAAMSDVNNKVNITPLNRSNTHLNEGEVMRSKSNSEGTGKGMMDMVKGLMGGKDGDVTTGAAAGGAAEGGGMAAFMQAISDKNQKTKIAPPSDEKLGRFVDSLKAYEYNYKDPTQPGAGPGKFVSPMAQDIEKTELGQGLVEDTPQGKIVNYGKAGGLMLATAAMLNDRLNDIEGAMAGVFKKKNKKG